MCKYILFLCFYPIKKEKYCNYFFIGLIHFGSTQFYTEIYRRRHTDNTDFTDFEGILFF